MQTRVVVLRWLRVPLGARGASLDSLVPRH